jgi:hypothetical protein
MTGILDLADELLLLIWKILDDDLSVSFEDQNNPLTSVALNAAENPEESDSESNTTASSSVHSLNLGPDLFKSFLRIFRNVSMTCRRFNQTSAPTLYERTVLYRKDPYRNMCLVRTCLSPSLANLVNELIINNLESDEELDITKPLEARLPTLSDPSKWTSEELQSLNLAMSAICPTHTDELEQAFWKSDCLASTALLLSQVSNIWHLTMPFPYLDSFTYRSFSAQAFARLSAVEIFDFSLVDSAEISGLEPLFRLPALKQLIMKSAAPYTDSETDSDDGPRRKVVKSVRPIVSSSLECLEMYFCQLTPSAVKWLLS